MDDRICAYLGPEGTFAHQATELITTVTSEFRPAEDVKAVVGLVEDGICDFGLVPIENSVEGEVNSTIDQILFGSQRVLVREEVVLPVSFSAFVLPGARGQTRVLSHPHALAQCRRFVGDRRLTSETTTSTSEACRLISEKQLTDAIALSSPKAGDLYGLEAIAIGVQDTAAAHTKFFLLGRTVIAPADRPGAYRTWIAIVPPSNRTGVLAEILAHFAERRISITSISTRPLRAQLGAYCFLLTIDGWVEESGVRAALGGILGMGSRVRVLGSFPAWKGLGVVPSVLSLGGLAPDESHAFFSELRPIPKD